MTFSYPTDDEAFKRKTFELRRSQAQFTGRPYDPICKRYPDEISEYVRMAEEYEIHPDEFVISEEGTYNLTNGHFLCTDCWIKAGEPSTTSGWACP